MKFGIMDVTLGQSTDSDTFARAAQLGAEGVEINLKIADLRDPQSPRAVRLAALAQQYGISVPSTVLGEHNSGGLATWWRGKEADEEVRLALEFTASIGATTLLVPFFFFNEPKGRTHRVALAERIKPLAERAERVGVTFAYEGVTSAEQMLEMAERVASPAFGVYFDMANVTWCDLDAPAQIRALGSLLRQTHVKDARTFTGDARLGEGRVDHLACAAAFRSIGYDRWMVLETQGGKDAEISGDLAAARRVYGT